LTRRTALGALVSGAVVVGVAGCGLDLSGGTPETRRKRAIAKAGPDEVIVVELVTALRQSSDLLTRTGARYPGLVGPLKPFLTAQAAQVAVLRDAARKSDLPSSSPAAVAVAGSRQAALVAARTNLEALRSTCYAAAVRAESGAFARLVASIGVSVSQRLPGLVTA
jgi:hypothetical protein